MTKRIDTKKAEEQVLQLLKDNAVEFDIIEHPPAPTCDKMVELAKIGRETIGKSMLVKTGEGHFVIAVIPGDKTLSSKQLELAAGAKAQLADSSMVEAVLGCKPGEVHPFGNLIGAKTVMDVSLLGIPKVHISPGTCEKTIALSPKDILKLSKGRSANLFGEKKTKESKTRNDDSTLGMSAKKDRQFSEWYTQVLIKSEMMDYSKVSGCMIIRPKAYHIWELIQGFFNPEIRKLGVENCYFPLFIPESLLTKEAAHVEGFSPEVAWVTESGNTKMPERIAIRPTSETIMYDSFSKWIRSHKDLPLKLNQWCNVVRWEFKNPLPFIRTREFLWQEGHTAHTTRQDSEKEVYQILDIYARVYEELLAVPVMKGTKSEKEKFSGALFTTSIETFLPNGKAVQAATSHCLGQNFARAFDIRYSDESGKKRYVWQNSWGLTTRAIGIMAMMHSDDKGLVLPPKVAPVHAVIVPIFKGDEKSNVLDACHNAKRLLKRIKVIVDDREDYTPGWKFNDAELKGIPLRIEIGPKDIEKAQAVVVRRDTSEKIFVPLNELNGAVYDLLEAIQKNLFARAREFIDKSIKEAFSVESVKKIVESKGMAKIPWCGSSDCEEDIKWRSGGAKSLNTPLDSPRPEASCAGCKKDAKHWTFFAKSY